MSSKDADATTKIVLDAIRISRCRAVLLSGWGGFSDSQLPDNVFCIDSVPHDWLFPRMALSVHHGGAGTTGATLRAGIPSVIVPFSADQPFWGWIIESQGLGYSRVSRKKLTSTVLADQITSALTNSQIRNRTAEVGRTIRNEGGVTRAVNLLEKHLAE